MSAPFKIAVDQTGVRVYMPVVHPTLGRFAPCVWFLACTRGEHAEALEQAREVARLLNEEHQQRAQVLACRWRRAGP
ncbi:MAG: hypothetical protein KIS79_07845 [Burkholderiales bacterium]|nr:hypothetical protein [Burkholderiales bacterium]